MAKNSNKQLLNLFNVLATMLGTDGAIMALSLPLRCSQSTSSMSESLHLCLSVPQSALQVTGVMDSSLSEPISRLIGELRNRSLLNKYLKIQSGQRTLGQRASRSLFAFLSVYCLLVSLCVCLCLYLYLSV